MDEVVRTPDDRFADLPDFPFEPHYAEADGLRLAYLDEGEGPAVVFFHGEPTWSFLWRKLVPPVVAAGFRAIAPDYAGFGRSDKPTDIGWYTYDRHTRLMESLLGGLGVADAAAVVHDWGGPIGLRVAVEAPGMFSRLVIMETAPVTGHQRMTDDWLRFRFFVAKTEDLPIGFLVRGGCFNDPGDAVIGAYDAPFPNPESKAGARAFPAILPTEPDAPGAAAGRAVMEALVAHPLPGIVIWAGNDPILPEALGRKLAGALGYDEPTIVPEAGHFLQEDAGPTLGGMVAEWLAATT
ncbi:MAG: haloalkane dehalogenase [Acidimicrobiia bacterium]